MTKTEKVNPPNQITINIPIPDEMEKAQIFDYLHEFCELCGRKLQHTKYEQHLTFNLVRLLEKAPKNVCPEHKTTGETT